MAEALVFSPPRRNGRRTLGLLLPIPALLAVFALIQAIQPPPDLSSPIYLLLSAALAAAVPWLAYRLYSLDRSSYILEREGMRIQWGLRSEDIPMDDIRWVKLANEIGISMPLPVLRLPGSILGKRRSPDLGEVEFLASDAHALVLVATPSRVFAISPEEPLAFLHAFQELVELGSLASIPAASVHPTSLLRRIWRDRPARLLVVAGLLLGLALIVWVGMLAPSTAEIPVGFLGPGTPRPPTSAVRLILLPVVSTTFLLIDWSLGAIFYRQDETRPLAYVLWTVAVITPVLFLAAVVLITRV